MKLEEQVVLITGAGRGIGAGIAQAFAAAGSAVIVNDIDPQTAERCAQGLRDAGGRATAIQADISDRAAVGRLFHEANAAFGVVTTLINNAAVVPYQSFTDYTPELWQRTIAVDLGGVFHCTHVYAQQIDERVRRDGGAVVHIASVHASATLRGTTAYAASKAGIVGMTRSMALDLGRDHIRVNAVSPGAIEADALQAYFDSLPPDKRDAERAHMLTWQPLGRFGTPQDIANLVLFLCSDAAAFINGTEIVADGGLLARLF
jgi:NAD(P)-dependent dehydrogenase (short-subunit alcohol dehydrogenase family)